MIKKPKLTKEEQKLEREIGRGEWKMTADWPKRKKELEQAARNTLKKSARVNIRLSPMDLQGIKHVAVREGLPYQTLIASVMHKFVTGQLVPR